MEEAYEREESDEPCKWEDTKSEGEWVYGTPSWQTSAKPMYTTKACAYQR